ncbi:hypothetical protein V8B97DRAFT_1918649 [Scleroderma yunnanense]
MISKNVMVVEHELRRCGSGIKSRYILELLIPLCFRSSGISDCNLSEEYSETGGTKTGTRDRGVLVDILEACKWVTNYGENRENKGGGERNPVPFITGPQSHYAIGSGAENSPARPLDDIATLSANVLDETLHWTQAAPQILYKSFYTQSAALIPYAASDRGPGFIATGKKGENNMYNLGVTKGLIVVINKAADAILGVTSAFGETLEICLLGAVLIFGRLHTLG